LVDVGDQFDEAIFVELPVRVLGYFGRVKREKVQQLIDDGFFVGVEMVIVLGLNRRHRLGEIKSAEFERRMFP
jgi:hypothetical protein